MLRVALTGGIATGKSYVLGRFAALGAACLEADRFAHGAMAAGTEAAAKIADRFGSVVMRADGEVDRTQLAAIVFSDDRARRELEAIVHPAVYRAIEAALRALARLGETRVAIVEVPLVYETGQAVRFDRIVATVCLPDRQVTRLLARGLSRDEAWARLAAQMPPEEKGRLADFVIRTDGSLDDTEQQVLDVWAALLRQPSA
jgi:dephospho-CoA kinase